MLRSYREHPSSSSLTPHLFIMPTAVLRRYTPPTCTLEIAAAGSALSRWTDRTVLKNLRFHLSFDDPKLSPDQQITVSGDQTQLEALSEVVSAYVQSLLHTAPDQVRWEAPLQLDVSPTALTDANPTASNSTVSNHPASNPALPDPPVSSQPVSSHPVSSQPVSSHFVSSQAVAEVGGGQPNRMGIFLTPQGLLSHQLQLGSLATEDSGPLVRLTTLQLFDLANALEEYHSEAFALPSSSRPAWLKINQKWGSMAAVAVLALGATGAIAKFVMDVSTPAPQTASVSREREANSELNSELFPTLSPPPLEASPSITLQPLPPPPPTGTAQADSPGLPPVGVTQAPPAPLPAPTTETLPNSSTSDQQVTVIPDPGAVASAPAQSLAGTGSGGSTSRPEPPRLTGTEEAAPQAASRALAPAADSSNVPSNSTAANNSTAFDTIPQVAEIRSYFQQRWQPPDGLSQTLEYRLLLNSDGSLQRIVPLGLASENYLDRTSMPLMGEPFVSATDDGSTPQVRLVLKPNGTVQSFLEYAN